MNRKHKPLAMTIETVDGPRPFVVSLEGVKQASKAACDYIRWKYGRSRGPDRRAGDRRA